MTKGRWLEVWWCKVRGHEETGRKGDPLTDDDQLYCHNVVVVDVQRVWCAVVWSQSSDCECCTRHIQAAPLFEQTLITLTSQNKTCLIPNNKISFTYLCTDVNNQFSVLPTRRRGWSHLSRWCFFCWREDRLAGGRHRRPLFCTVSQLQRRKTSLASTFSLQRLLLLSSLPSGGRRFQKPHGTILSQYSIQDIIAICFLSENIWPTSPDREQLAPFSGLKSHRFVYSSTHTQRKILTSSPRPLSKRSSPMEMTTLWQAAACAYNKVEKQANN